MRPETSSTPLRPMIVAHRAGNRPETARRAALSGHVVEVDVHVFRGRVEVRHEKVLRPFARLWEPWRLLPRGTPRVELHQILEAVGPDATLLLDLKCFTTRAARRIRSALPETADVIVSSRSWWVLRAFDDRPATPSLRSCANRPQLWLGTRLPGLGDDLGVTAHQRLLSPERVAEIRRSTPLVFSWAIETSDRLRALVRGGLTGAVLDDIGLADD